MAPQSQESGIEKCRVVLPGLFLGKEVFKSSSKKHDNVFRFFLKII